MHLQQPKWKSHQNTNIKGVVTYNQVKTTRTLKYYNKKWQKQAWWLDSWVAWSVPTTGFVDQVTDNIQIEKKRKILTYFHPKWFLYWLLLPVLMNDLLYLIQNSIVLVYKACRKWFTYSKCTCISGYMYHSEPTF